MVNMTLAIPNELNALMKKHKEVRWSEVARRAIKEQAEKLEWMDKVLANSKFTKEDADIIGHKIKANLLKRLEVKRAAQNENNS